MEITFLGTGGSWPSKERNVTSIAYKIGAEVVLFDCGEGTQRQLMFSHLSFMDISRIFITHYHGDHFLGIPGLLQSMALNNRQETVEIYGPEGTVQNITHLLSAGFFNLTYNVLIHEVAPGETIDFESYSITAVRADHSVPTLAYIYQEPPRPGRFDKARALELGVPEGPMFRQLQKGEPVTIGDGTVEPSDVLGPPRRGRKVVYSGDTRISAEIEEASSGADALVHEATLSEEMGERANEYAHATAAEAAALAKRAGVKQLYLVHISPRYKERDVLLEEACAEFGNTIIPDDLEAFKVPLPKK